MSEKTVRSIEFAGKTLTVETGYLAKQAGGSALVRLGDTVVLVTVVAGKDPKNFIDGNVFLPLTVDFRERTYAAGKIPGGFFKRETRPREGEILLSRLIDRTIRPLFAEGWDRETQVGIMLVSSDGVNDVEMPSLVGVSIALQVSDIPFEANVAAVRIGMIDGKFIVNPTKQEQASSSLDLMVAGTCDAITMVECGAKELSEDQLLEALNLAAENLKTLCAFQEGFNKKAKQLVTPAVVDEAMKNEITSMSAARIEEILQPRSKDSRDDMWRAYKKEVVAALEGKYPEKASAIKNILEDLFYYAARKLVLDKRTRADGRNLDEVRPIESIVGILPRAHGSAVFTRGQTQALAVATLGTPGDAQVMDVLDGEYKERFMLHYNFPGFSTGEPKPERSPGRREIGHGNLARRALLPLLPSEAEFPYTIRIVSDILESNGSSSMASVCGGSLALFDAGVPCTSNCAGVAMGLVKEGDKYAILTDIMGMEDHLGDMDFKVTGTRKGVTALQMDIKIKGLTPKIMAEALEQARKGRLHILGKMEETMTAPRAQMSTFAPRMFIVQINPSKIGELIGPGGKNIRRIQEGTGAKIDIEDDGRVFISSTVEGAAEAAKAEVEGMSAEIEVGKVYTGKVTRLMNFGAFVEVLPGKEGLVHISQLAIDHVKRVEDVVKEGDVITVKCTEIDEKNRVNLSRKAVLLDQKK